MSKFWKSLSIAVSVLYVLFTIVSVWKLYNSEGNDNPLYENILRVNENHKVQSLLKFSNNVKKSNPMMDTSHMNKVEIWGKAAIGMYFWNHVMNSKLETSQNALVMIGNLTLRNILFTFRTGPGIIQSTVPMDVEYLVLILNGRNKDKIAAAILWLDYLPQYQHLQKLAVIILGDEECDNDWILPYVKSRGGKIDVLFFIYDSPLIDNTQIYQWPLGVAAYRGFPNILPQQVDLISRRSYLCNFLGTLYENSSRVTLTHVIRSSGFQEKCIIKGRQSWLPLETEDTFNAYIYSLSNSDLTLCPVGKNTECYRIYEAMSLGSVPVIEDVLTPGHCEHSKQSPLRLLKENHAPVIFIKDWNELPELLYRESQLTLAEKVKRRRTIVEWYQHFKETMRNKFIHVIEKFFFDS